MFTVHLAEMCTVHVLPKCAKYTPYGNVHSTCLNEMCTVHLAEMCTVHVLSKHSLPTTRSLHSMTLFKHTAAQQQPAVSEALIV